MRFDRSQIDAAINERIVVEAAREDMARVYGEERRQTPREESKTERPSIFLRRQAD